MGQFKLLVPHTSPRDQQYLEAGTLVGDDTPYPWEDPKGNPVPPSLGMVGVDDASQSEIDDHYDENVKNDPMLPKHRDDNTPDKAIEDVTTNRPNPNVSPATPNATQTRNESAQPGALRRGPVGASPAAPAKPPQGGSTGMKNPLDLGQSSQNKNQE